MSGVVTVFVVIGWCAIAIFGDHRNLPFYVFTVS